MDYPCKNNCCCDFVNIENTYCEDCAPYVKMCKECNDEFSDNSNFKKCFECRDEDNDSCDDIDTNDDIEINKVIKENNNQLNNINQYIHKVKKNSELPNEIKYKILLDVLKYKRREFKIKKSNQHFSMFKEYNEMANYTGDIDWEKYRIGDVVLHRGNTSYAFREKKEYIRSYCIKCKYPNNEKLGNGKDYFRYPDNYKCKSCRHEERYPCGGILADTGYKICRNCFESFKYNKDINYDSQNYCKWCNDIRIFDVNIKTINKTKIKI